MKTLLIIFTYKYPYEPPTEQFLHTEIPYLAKDGYTMKLIPYARGIDFAKKYESDCEHDISPLSRGKISDILLGMLSLVTGFRDIASEFFKIRKNVTENKSSAIKTMVKQHMQYKAYLSRLKKQINVNELKEYDRVLLYSYWLNPMALAIAEYKKHLFKKGVTGVKAIARAHGQGDLYIEEIEDTYRPFDIVLSSGLDCIYSISSQGCDYLKERNINNTSLARLGIENTHEFTQNRIDKDEFLIVSCSVINANKRVGEIAKAISDIKDNKIRWIHFGDGELFSEVESWCKENMPENIEWKLNGWTSNDEIQKFYDDNLPDLFINLSGIEGIPVSVMEAMSHSIPCIATDVGATGEIVKNGFNGFLAKKNFDAKNVSEMIKKIISQDDKGKNNFRKNAFDTWAASYDANSNFTQFSKDIVKYFSQGDENI